ncbi:BTB/POZ domain protein [Dictyocaulus viviparus]|uniref:BTB/POZ domain protein n=1 Tax=Dictyocaulus viviparus TaxID=29172 RepID=A0A0D8YBE1_DICVI|nr:BTB/POZ domain protein [Dictyocaulus viviparus]
MGNSLDRLTGYEDSCSSTSHGSNIGKKRKGDTPDSPPKKITKLDTAKYVYERLFLQGEGSDVTVYAVGHVWRLHKLYLQQCKYFEVLMQGNWKDSKEDVINLEFSDVNVTREGLHAVLGSLYHNQIELDLDNVEGVLSAASVLQEDTFIRLISSSELLIMEGEMDIYLMIKMWIFLREKPHAAALPDNDFNRQMNEAVASYPPGELFVKYAGLFGALRLHHITTSIASLNVLESDKLIPEEVLRAVMVDQWKTILTNEENPTAVNELSMDDFHVNSLRLGRLIDNMPKCWRWTGFNNGVDIVMGMSHGVLTMKRNCLSQATPYSINLKSERVVHYRVIISDNNGICLFDSTKQCITLRLDQSVVVARLGDDIMLPISVHLLYLASQPAPPSFLYVNHYIKEIVRKEDECQEISETL